MSNNNKETMTKKQQDDLASTFNNLPWGLPLGFPSLSPFGAFPTFGLPTPNFPPLNSFGSSSTTAFLPSSSLLSNDSTNPSTSTDLWSNGLSTTNNPIDYNEYAKQLGFLMNAFTEQQQQQQQQQETDKTKASPTTKHSKSKSSHTSSPDVINGKKHDDSRRSSSSSSTTIKSSSRSKSSLNPTSNLSSSSKTSTTTTDSTMLDPLAFAAAAAAASGSLTFPYFLPSLLSQTSSTTNNNNTNNPSTYPFSSLPTSLTNPTAGLYPFLSPDWFTSASSSPSIGNITPDLKQSKKRSKSIRTLTEEQDKNSSSLLHLALTDPTNTNGLRMSRRNSTNDTHVDDSRSNDDDDSDPNPKRKKLDEVNETLVRIPLNRGWKRVTIVRAITRTGVRGDVSYYAPCGRKLRSFQEIDRYLSKKNITDLDRSNFTFSSKVHIGFFHEPKEGPDGKTIFHESTEDEIVNRILEINPKFRRIETSSSPCLTPSNGTNDYHDDHRKLRLEQEEISKRAAEIKTKRETMRLTRNIPNECTKTSDTQYQHNDFIKAIIEQQKFVQQHELEHKQKFQQEQQEQERKRQELAYLKQLELKKRQEEKLLLIEQRKAEKNAQREKKIQEKYMEIVLAKEMKRITEDMQLRDLKPLPILKPIENMRLSIEAFANCLMIIEFLNNFKHILNIPDNLIPTLNSLQQSLLNSSSSRDLNSLCQILLRIALEDPGIPNPKKALTNLGQKLSEIDITEHTFSEILRIYIRERNGFDDKLSQSLSDVSFQVLIPDEKAEILAFLCNDLSTNKRVVDEIDRNLEELISLKHEKWEIEKRLRRLKFEKYNNTNSNSNVKKMATLLREKDLNSSDNESPDDSDGESMKNDDETSITNDPATITADDQDIETLDETKIDDIDKRLVLVTRKYILIKRRVIDKQCRIRALHLGQDRYRRRYWFFSHLPGIYIEGLTSGDISSDDIQNIIENVTKQKHDNKPLTINNEYSSSSRSTQRKKQQIRITNITSSSSSPPPSLTKNSTIEQSPIIELNKIKNDNSDNEDEQQQQINTTNNLTEDLATMDLSAFCMAVKRDNDIQQTLTINEEKSFTNGTSNDVEIKSEPSDEPNSKCDVNEINDDNLPLDLSCSKSKRTYQDDYWTSQHTQAVYPLTSSLEQFQELNDLATTAMLINNIKQEQTNTNLSKNILDLTNVNLQNMISNQLISTFNLSTPIKHESSTTNFKQIEQSIREKFQYSQPLPIPDDVQSGWWLIQTPEELRSLIKSLAKRGQRERYLCRMLQRYFDIITNSMLNIKNENSLLTIENDNNENENDEQQQQQQQQQILNDFIENDNQNFDDKHEMDVLNEIYNLSDRIIASSLQCRSYDINTNRKRLTYIDIQAKGSDILDEAKHLLTDIERNIERRYLKHPFVRKYELNLSSLNRINQYSTYHHTLENSTNEIVSSSKYDEVPQQLERWRRTVNESRTPAQLALCLTQLERCIAWERSIMRVYCEICNSDVDEEKLLLCDGCDRGTHTYCFIPPMSFIPPNDWYCYVCIGKAKGENLCFVCGNKGDNQLNRCEHCGKLFHEDCLKNAKQQRGKWLCVLCAANDSSALIATLSAGNNNTKWQTGRQTFRSTNTSANATNNSTSKSRQPSISSTSSLTNTNGESLNNSSSSSNRNRSNTNTTTTTTNNNNNNRKSKPRNSLNNIEISISHESHSNSSHTDAITMSSLNESSSIQSPSNIDDIDDDISSPTMGGTINNSKKKTSRKSKSNTDNNDIKACRIILNELLKNDASWPFQTPVDAKQHPEYYECIKTPMDFSTMKKKMRNHQYTKRDEFFNDVQLILNNCEYYNEDDSPVGEAGHVLRTFFETRWAKQFG
ncbi:unnamed protein product [Rotaria sordida]|uniref:Bromodomain adjacent to zinc finger domain protein 2B-like n=1 Tax=Rotaria sordida TaxID=392033 RepID=A0A818P1H0_9BILA|nr:unnamed protein product [Rotaria sordida]CAF3614135.1 unnamed protein product [Rotaria sordida]